MAAANQSRLLGVMDVATVQGVSMRGDLELLCFIPAVKPEKSLTVSGINTISLSHVMFLISWST